MWPFNRGPSVRQQLADAHAYVDTLESEQSTLIENFNALHRQKETLLTADGIKQQTIDVLTEQHRVAAAARDDYKALADNYSRQLDSAHQQIADLTANLAEVTRERDARTQQLADAAAKRSDAIARGNRKRAETRRANAAPMHVQH